MCSGVDYISEDFAFGEVARKDGIVWLLFSSMSSRRSVETVISYARSAGAERFALSATAAWSVKLYAAPHRFIDLLIYP